MSFGFECTSTSYCTHLAADKTVVDSFFLQPHSVLLPPGNASYPQLQELGYLVDRFATTASGVVYIYGRTGYSLMFLSPVSLCNLSLQFGSSIYLSNCSPVIQTYKMYHKCILYVCIQISTQISWAGHVPDPSLCN